MAYNPRDVQNAIVNLLDGNQLALTANLDLDIKGASLTSVGVYKGIPKHVAAGVGNLSYPFITIWAASDVEDWAQLGNATAKKLFTLDMNIAASTRGAYDANDDPASGSDDSDNEQFTLVSNIKDLLRGEPKLSNTVLFIETVDTVYDADIEGAKEDTFISTALLTARCQVLST